MSGGVLVDDGERVGDGWKKENSGSKFRNSVQSRSKVGGVGGNGLSCGISNKEKSFIASGTPGRGPSLFDVSVISVDRACADSPGAEGMTSEGRDGGLKKSRSNDDLSGSVETGFGSWKDWSKSNHAGTVTVGSGSDTAYRRLTSTPLGRLG